MRHVLVFLGVLVASAAEAQFTQQGAPFVGTASVSVLRGGVALSADGNTALVGGVKQYEATPIAWVFVRSGGRWTQQGPPIEPPDAIGTFGPLSAALSADGSTALLGGS